MTCPHPGYKIRFQGTFGYDTFQIITNIIAIKSKVKAENEDQQNIDKSVGHNKGNIHHIGGRGLCEA